MGLRDQEWLRFCLTLRDMFRCKFTQGIGLKDQAWLGFFLTLRESIEALIYPRHGSEGSRMAGVLFNP